MENSEIIELYNKGYSIEYIINEYYKKKEKAQ